MSNGSRSCPTVTLPFGLFADTPTIVPLDPTDFPPADPPPALEQFIEDNAPTDATPDDGFDQVFSDAVGFVDALDSALGALGDDLVAAFAEADLIDPGPVGDVVAGFGASLAPSDTAVDNLGALLATLAPPQPPGGGGSGGGTQGCVAQDFGSVKEGTVKKVSIQLTNQGSASVHIKGIVVVGNAGPNIFAISNTYQGTDLPPNRSLPLTIAADASVASPGNYSSTLIVNTNQADPQPCMILTATVTPGTPSGGGGGGGAGAGGDGGSGGHTEVIVGRAQKA